MSFTEVFPHQIDTWCYIYPWSIIHISMCKSLVYQTIVFLTINHLFCMCLERAWETSAQSRDSSSLILADDLNDVYLFANFAMHLQREPISFKLQFIFLLFIWCKRFVHIMSKDLLCQSDVSDQSWNYYYCKETLSNWSTSIRFLIFNTHIHIW